MKKSKYAPIYRALGAWVLSLMMLLTPLLAWAQPALQPLEITLEWTGVDGTPKVASATPVPYPGYENTLWLYLDAEAIGQDASLRLNDTMGQFAGGFALPDGRRLEGDMPLSSLPYVDAGTAPGDLYMEIWAYVAAEQPPTVFRLYLSLMAVQPEPPEEEPTAEPTMVPDAQVSVFYVDANQAPVAEGRTEFVPAGSSAVITAPQSIGDYVLTGAAEQQVYVDGNGVANPGQVFFVYALPETPEPITAPDAQVSIFYVDQNNQAITDMAVQMVPAGSSAMITAPQSIGEYLLSGAAEQQVFVDENGVASPGHVVFVYVLPETPEPTTVPDAQVGVFYVDQDNQPVADAVVQTIPAGSSATITAPQNIGDYLLAGAAEQQVFVDKNGVASPDHVVFVYVLPETPEPTAEPLKAWVSVVYLDTNQMPIAPGHDVEVTEGITPVIAMPQGLGEEYQLQGPDVQEVELTADGALIPEQVVFTYQYVGATVVVTDVPTAEPTIEPTVEPTDAPAEEVATDVSQEYIPVDGEPINRWAEVTASSLNFRKGTSRNADIITELTRGTRFYVYDQQTVDGKAWWHIMANGREGYLMAEYARMLNDAENTAMEASLASPVPLPQTAVPETEVPETAAPETPALETPAPETAAPETATAAPQTQPEEEPPLQAQQQPPAAEPTPIVDGMPINRWGAVTINRVNFREGPGTSHGIIVEFKQNALLYIYTQETVDGTPWYQGVFNGRTGYIMAKYVRLLTDEENAAQEATLATPVPPFTTEEEPTTEPTQEPTLEPTAEPTEEPTPEPTEEPTPIISGPVDVNVYYEDLMGNLVATTQVFSAVDGTNSIEAKPTDLKEGYVLDDEAVKYVIVKNNEAQPSQVRFLYAQVEAPASEEPAPAPMVKIVYVYYKDQLDNTLYTQSVTCYENENNIILADPKLIPGNENGKYALNDVPQKTVTVDSEGNATPEEVVFLFADTRAGMSTDVKVHFRLEDGTTLAPSKDMTIRIGSNDIWARPDALPQGYTLLTQEPVQVTLSEKGVATPAEVVFLYAKSETVVTPTPTPTEMTYELTEMDAYGYPTGDAINFRSSPAIADNNVLSVVGRKDLAHIQGSYVNVQKELWYYAEIGSRKGFIKESVVRLLSDQEVAALMGYTPAPSPTATLPATAIPDNTVIDRWAEITANSVRFRSDTTTSSSKNIVDTLAKGTRIWVYTQQTVGGEPWFKAKAKNKDGYVMAQFVELLSREASEQYQAQLASPMPVQTLPATATAEPTSEPTAEPTATPSPTAVAVTETPLPYQGYALTIQQVALRSGSSDRDETILATLPVDTLLYLWGQTYVDGVEWNSAEAIAIARTGFVPESALRRISAQEAEYHRSLIKPVATATPTPTVEPAQIMGYAITLGDFVPMRTHFDQYAEIMQTLDASTVVKVLGQQYAQDTTWHFVQWGQRYGFVRADQLRMLNAQEEAGYLESLRTPLPTMEAPTVPPVTQNSPSSYGYVNTDNVRLRAEANTNATVRKMMSKNAFALVLGSVQQPDGLWYHINQGGTEGYVMNAYFTVLPLGQLTGYLQSQDYINANPAGAGQTNATVPNTITSVEDFNSGVWKNPALAQASYEPFNPLGTPTPAIEAVVTPSPSVSPTMDPIPSFSPMASEIPTQGSSSSFPGALLAVGILGVLGAGGFYGYRLYRENQRRAAQRAVQRRQAQGGQPGQPPASPYARPAQGQSRQPGTSPYAPPAPRTPGAPPTQPGAGAPSGATRPTQVQPPVRPGSVPFKPDEPTASSAPYRPPQPYTPATQSTTTVPPAERPTQAPMPPAKAATPPAQAPNVPASAGQQPSDGLTRDVRTRPAPQDPAQPGSDSVNGPAQPTQRRRRADRHTDA